MVNLNPMPPARTFPRLLAPIPSIPAFFIGKCICISTADIFPVVIVNQCLFCSYCCCCRSDSIMPRLFSGPGVASSGGYLSWSDEPDDEGTRLTQAHSATVWWVWEDRQSVLRHLQYLGRWLWQSQQWVPWFYSLSPALAWLKTCM